MLRKRLISILGICLAILLIVHFGITFLYLTPNNPLRSKHWKMISGYMYPYFSQNWYLFAPNPVNQHQNLQIKLKVRTKEGAVQETKWIDITKPMLKKLYANRFSPHQRIYEFQSSAMHTYVYDEEDRNEAEKHLRLYVDYYLKTNPKPDQKILAYQMRIVTNKFPRYSQRHLPDSKGKIYYDYSDWFNYSD